MYVEISERARDGKIRWVHLNLHPALRVNGATFEMHRQREIYAR